MIDKIDKESAEVTKMGENWPIISALLGGTTAIRKGREKYLPQWPKESDDNYKTRVSRATLYPAFKRTLKVLASKPFSKSLAIKDDVPESIRGYLDDVDLQGRNLQAFLFDVMKTAIAYGIDGVLVEFPKKGNASVTVADEKAEGLRPYLVQYPPGSVLGWRKERINGVEKLTQLRLKETFAEPGGEYGESDVTQIRVLSIDKWEIFRKDKNGDWVSYDHGVNTIGEIPFVPFYGDRTGFMTGESPLAELAHQNIEHYQSCSDQQTILHMARVPILITIGLDPETSITVGGPSATNLPMGSSMQFVEHSGAAIAAGRQSILDLEERMRQTGAELLMMQPGQIATIKIASENEANRCDLQRITENFEDSINQVLQFMAKWVGEENGGTVELFKDFGVSALGTTDSNVLLSLSQAGIISNETTFNEQKRRGILSADLTFEDEKEKIDEQGPPLGTIGKPRE